MNTTTETIDLSTALAAQETLKIDPRGIYADPSLNTRGKKPSEKELKSLREDIRANGVQTPVKVFISDGSEGLPEPGVPVLVFGFTRVQLAKELIEETGSDKYFVPYTVLEEIPSKLEAFEMNLAENFKRNNLTAWDEVLSIVRYEQEFGVASADKIAEGFGKSGAWVRQRRRLYTDLHPEIQKRLMKHEDEPGFVPSSVAMELLDIEDKEEQLEALKAVEMDGKGVATRDAVKKKVAEAAEEGKAKPKARTAKNLEAFYSSYIAPPEQGEDEDPEEYTARVEAHKADPLVPFFRLQLKFMAGMKEKTFLKQLREIVVAKGNA